MDAGSQLKNLLQLQLASDSSAVIHLPYVLSSLTEDCFVQHPHLAKWAARINALLHSKEPGGRWAGLCIAHKSSIVSKSFMVESAPGWLPTVIPILSRAEPTAILKAAIRLLISIFTKALDMSEFQRQISLPHVLKFTAALSNMAATHEDLELKACCLDSLAMVVPVYPNTHRATFSNLSGLAMGFLNGNYPHPTSTSLIEAASRLYSILHLTGGKVGAATLWKNAIDGSLLFGWEAYFALRTTFSQDTKTLPQRHRHEDPAVAILLNLDRIRCCSVIIRQLLSTVTIRPVQVPCGLLVKYALALLGASTDGQIEAFVDPTTRSMEITVVPSLWNYGCEIVVSLANSIPHSLESNLSRIYTTLVFRLEQPLTPNQRAPILAAFQRLLESSCLVDSPILPNRTLRAVLPDLIVVLSASTSAEHAFDGSESKKGKKVSKNYAGDEVFKLSRDIICPTELGAKALLSALEVVRYSTRNPNLSSSLLSLASRVLLSVQLTLAQLSPSILSSNPQVFHRVQEKVHAICAEVALRPTISSQKILPLIIRESIKTRDTELHASFDLLLHPRLPPIVRPIPTMQALSLFRVEESEEEASARKQLGLEFTDEETVAPTILPEKDEVMHDSFPPAAATTKIRGQFPFSDLAIANRLSDTPAAKHAAPNVQKDELRLRETVFASSSVGPEVDFIQSEGEEDDEEMPSINMASDSEDDE